MEKLFALKIIDWYSSHQRSLPWRQNPTPYHVLISEIMLQQTQVPRVIEKFNEFTAQFPTLQDLANAPTADVIQSWSGLGYNRRALLLHKFAQEVVKKYNGIIPNSAMELIKLPGIGPYTAGAIASFAYNKPEPAIDVNIRRIYLRYFHGKDQGLPMGKKEEQELYQLAKSTIPEGKSAQFHNALMDFGSLVCTRDAPLCAQCPLQKSCHFFPLYTKKKEKVLFVMEKREEKGVFENGRFIPNRIFRGRIVEWVRKNQGKLILIQELGKKVKKDYTAEEEKWLLDLIEKLNHENLIDYKIKARKIKLVLPSS